MTPQDAYHELCCYTLSHRNPSFLHQHVVDAFAAQHANNQTKPITLTFALVGLYLHVERGLSGRQVQRVHMALARRKRVWPSFPAPPDRGAMTVADVLATEPGAGRDESIHAWCACVWEAFCGHRRAVVELLGEYGMEWRS